MESMGATLEKWLGEATEMMLDLAGVREGSMVQATSQWSSEYFRV
jgi:hypothetical protein